jgi:predicted TIM-barrel fold metal-dependent hydrolase
MNMHPTAPLNMHGMDQRPLVPGMAFMFDTSLATMRLIMSGVFEEEPDLTLIVPHTGGFVPYIRGRVERLVDAWAPSTGWPKLPHPAHEYFDKIYVDTVAHSPEALTYCYQRYGADKLLYGTDHPFAHFHEYNVMVDTLDCTDAERELINRGNAERLLGFATEKSRRETR